MALADAKLDLRSVDATRVGVFMGTSVGTAEYLAENHAVFLEKGIRRVHPLFPAHAYSGVVATELAISLGVKGPALCVSTACTSAADAAGIAALLLRSGQIDVALVGGAEAPLTPILFAAFDRLGVMSRQNDRPEQASRPFSTDRDGFVMSEGAGVCVFEGEDFAQARGARLLAEFAGYGATSDGFHPFSPLPSGEEGARAIALALEEAGVSPAEVDYVNAHAIGSKPNDPIEVEILRRVFGEFAPKIPVSSIKSMIGHAMGAAPALELIACVAAIRDSTVPPTANLTQDTAIADLDFVPERPRPMPVRTVLSPTFGFGSRNAAVVVRSVQLS
jgi:3-oxoacyl-[acyl-carrier-protein] synthase II